MTIPPDLTTFWNQSRQKGLKPKVVSVAKALLFPATVLALGKSGNKISTEVWWTASRLASVSVDQTPAPVRTGPS